MRFEGLGLPSILRRHDGVPKAGASLAFGGYLDFSGAWIDDPRAVYLAMIASDGRGDGGRLLDAITRLAGRLSLAIVGKPARLHPLDWCGTAPFEYSEQRLLGWYRRHGFDVLVQGSDTRVVHRPLGCEPERTSMACETAERDKREPFRPGS